MNPLLENEFQAVIYKNYTNIIRYIYSTNTEIQGLIQGKNREEIINILNKDEVRVLLEKEVIKFIRRPGYLDEVNALRKYLPLPRGQTHVGSLPVGSSPLNSPPPISPSSTEIVYPSQEELKKPASLFEKILVTLIIGGMVSFVSGGSKPKSIVLHKRDNKSILDRPGLVSKLILGDNVTETLFTDLPYPLNILKNYL